MSKTRRTGFIHRFLMHEVLFNKMLLRCLNSCLVFLLIARIIKTGCGARAVSQARVPDNKMSRRWWLTVFLAIQFLPWPGSEFFLGRGQGSEAAVPASLIRHSGDYGKQRASRTVTTHLSPLRNDWEVFCESDEENLEKEKEPLGERWFFIGLDISKQLISEANSTVGIRYLIENVNDDGYTAIKHFIIQKC